MKINFNHIYYFSVIAKEGSIKNAATKLNISTSALSDQLRHLEDRLGDKLFDRKSNKLVTSSTGEYLLENLGSFFEDAEIALENIMRSGVRHRQQINLGIAPAVSKNRIFRLVKPYLQDSRYIVNIYESSIFNLHNKLEKNELDVIIYDASLTVSSVKFAQHEILDRKFVAVTATDDLSLVNKFPSCLNGHAFVHYTKDNVLYEQITKYFEQHAIVVHEYCRVDDINLVKIITEHSNCFCIVPYVAVEKDLATGRLIKLGNVDELTAKLYLCTRKNNHLENEINQILLAAAD